MSLIDYHKSTTLELLALTNKVRSLISHWSEDGRYKEAVLKNIISRFLPEKFTIGTGFVIKQTENRGDHLSSRQIDLLIYDDASPVLFKEGDFVILTPDAVRGIIEIKANLQNQRLTDIVRQANENGKFIFSGKEDKIRPFFNGIFSYEGYNNSFDIQNFIRTFKGGESPFLEECNFKNYSVNHVVLNKDWFVKVWAEDEDPHSLYHVVDLAFPFFISNLTDMLSDESVRRNNFIWYATNKEINLNCKF